VKPARFDFVRPASLAEASRLLTGASEAARLVAGCQSLGPMLNLRLATPRLLIDLTGIAELARVEDHGDAVTVGACITHANIEDRRLPGPGLDALVGIARHIAYRAVRNRGTIGGSLCHADPAADWVAVLCAFDAQCIVFAPGGRRLVPASGFVAGAFENVLAPGEILEAVTIPRLSPHGRFGYYKVCRKAGEFASALGAVLWDPGHGWFRAVIGATRGKPIVVGDARQLKGGATALDDGALLALFARHDVSDPATRRQQAAALSRAWRQAAPQ